MKQFVTFIVFVLCTPVFLYGGWSDITNEKSFETDDKNEKLCGTVVVDAETEADYTPFHYCLKDKKTHLSRFCIEIARRNGDISARRLKKLPFNDGGRANCKKIIMQTFLLKDSVDNTSLKKRVDELYEQVLETSLHVLSHNEKDWKDAVFDFVEKNKKPMTRDLTELVLDLSGLVLYSIKRFKNGATDDDIRQEIPSRIFTIASVLYAEEYKKDLDSESDDTEEKTQTMNFPTPGPTSFSIDRASHQVKFV